MIYVNVPLQNFAFLRESTTKPTDDRITLIAYDDHRFWWVFSNVDGVEFVVAPEHRLIDPLSIAVGQKTRDYAGLTYAHKRIRLKTPPVKLLAAIEQAKLRQQPRVIHRTWKPYFYCVLEVRCWRLRRRLGLCLNKWKGRVCRFLKRA